jgi:hypothetical protein
VIKRTRFLTLQANNARRELAVNIQCFLSSDRVTPHNWVDMFHWFTSHDAATLAGARELSLLDP